MVMWGEMGRSRLWSLRSLYASASEMFLVVAAYLSMFPSYGISVLE